MKCLICNKQLEKPRRKYCSKKCLKKEHDLRYYLRHKEKCKRNAREWESNNVKRAKELRLKAQKKYRANNKEKIRKIVLGYYYKNKDKWTCRGAVYRMLKAKKNPIKLEKVCSCGSKNVTLKFEVYPKKEEIRKAIEEKKIYYICYECRRKNGNRI